MKKHTIFAWIAATLLLGLAATAYGDPSVPPNKQTVLGLYVTAREAFTRWHTDKTHIKIVDGFEGDALKLPESYNNGRRLVNGWKNSGAPWTYRLDPQLTYNHGDARQD